MGIENGKWSPGYNAANLDHLNAVGLEAGLHKIDVRIRSRKDCPTWLIEELNACIRRASLITPILKLRRDDAGGYNEQ